MKTLLKIFFYPYLQFLLKIHLYVVVAVFLIFVLQVKELVYFAPQIYGLAIYMFMARHTFKQNISWMLATFNKKTLVQYHLISQTIMMVILFSLNIIFGLGFMTLAHLILPEEKVMTQNPVLNSAAAEGFTKSGMNIHEFIDAFWSTRETVWVYLAIFFLLYVIYSPVNAQEQFKKLHEKRAMNVKKMSLIYASVMGGGFFFVYFSLHEFMIPIISLIFVLGIIYVAITYNNVFLFLPRKKLIWGLPIAVMMFFGFNLWMFAKSVDNYENTQAANRRIRELLFMSRWAPELNESDLLKLVGEATQEDIIKDLVKHSYYQEKLAPEAILTYFEKYPTPALARFIVKDIDSFKAKDIEAFHTKDTILWLSQTTDNDRKIKVDEAQSLVKRLPASLSNK